ncbi:MAG: hypothetical protein IJF67_10725 [Clostridia bacterium]|nr:hypothetical protein [Clostridia bacterium]
MKFIPGQSELYAAPILGNGEITLQLGPDGTMAEGQEAKIQPHSNPSRCIWWAARRDRFLQTKDLIPFGRFVQSVITADGELDFTESEQELDTEGAMVTCRTAYGEAAVIETEAFIPQELPLICVRKTITPAAPLTYRFTYALCGKEGFDVPPRRLECFVSTDADKKSAFGGIIAYRCPGQDDCMGNVLLFSDTAADRSGSRNGITLSYDIDKPAVLCFYILLADTMTDPHPGTWALNAQAEIENKGWAALEAGHRENWQRYYAEGGASLGDPLIDRVYMTAQYHQRCYTTKWSLPVAVNDASWQAKCFGFDEFFMLEGLLTSGHIEAAMRVPEFRLKGLAIARQRCSSKHHTAARYPWETIEDGTEAATPGFWYEHIFHMATIPLGAWDCFRFTNDRAFLARVFPMISACAEFFRLHCIYRVEGGKTIVGKCTDLERLGSAVENPYMTTCSVIATLRAYADAADTLALEPEWAAESREMADKLLAGLPHDGERYVPYPGCTERSIASFAGTYPFRVRDLDAEKELRAMRDYLEYEDIYGNMYATGRGVCSWYGGWKAVAFSRLGMAEEAAASLEYVAARTGNFGEVYEIGSRETNTFYRPWFTTAAGMYMNALNEMLLQPDGSEITLAPGLSAKYDSFTFTLASHGDVKLRARAAGGVLTALSAEFGENCPYDAVTVHVPARFALGAGITGTPRRDGGHDVVLTR